MSSLGQDGTTHTKPCVHRLRPFINLLTWRPDLPPTARYTASQQAEVLGNASRLRWVGDQPDVSVGADEDQGVGAVRVCRVSVVVQEAAWPDKVGLDDVGVDVAEYWGAAFA